MKKLIIAFDMDDTLIIPSCASEFQKDIPNYETIAIYKWFQVQGNIMIIWSARGKDYAQSWAEKLGLKANFYLKKKKTNSVDLSFDDCDIAFGKINIKVKRFNNNIKRKLTKLIKK